MKIVECPRDAMQGIEEFIPTEKKIDYIQDLLAVGFDTVDFGSFVSPKAIPQMRDTAEVLKGLDLSETSSSLLAIVANQRGAEEASSFEEIEYLGYPFSVSDEFQRRNTKRSIKESIPLVEEIQDLCLSRDKKLVVYLSMGFGNPYGEEYHPELVVQWSSRLAEMGIEILALSDTIGVADPVLIDAVFRQLVPELPHVEFGAHFHTTPERWHEKVHAAFEAGCRRFDGAIKGFGGCPMAKDELTGNMPTEKLLSYMSSRDITNTINMLAFETAVNRSLQTFPN
jgi:hydroxymethylglutaryl-CoA lyase